MAISLESMFFYCVKNIFHLSWHPTISFNVDTSSFLPKEQVDAKKSLKSTIHAKEEYPLTHKLVLMVDEYEMVLWIFIILHALVHFSLCLHFGCCIGKK
jgi:hypothetical protein